MSSELTEILGVIRDPGSTIADATAIITQHFERVHETLEFHKVYRAFTDRWSIGSYEKVLRAAWAGYPVGIVPVTDNIDRDKEGLPTRLYL